MSGRLPSSVPTARRPALWTTAPSNQPVAGFAIYSPFRTLPDFEKFTAAWGLGKGGRTVLRHGDSPTPLSVVQPGMPLFLVCHCDPAAKVVSDGASNRLTAAQLADRLLEDGLSRSLKLLNFCACSGTAGGTSSFAAQLLRTLKDKGCATLAMRAFTGTAASAPQVAGTGYSQTDSFEPAGSGKTQGFGQGHRVSASCVNLRGY